jgi:hypothetical protein
MQDLTMNILGFAPANRDLTVEIRDPATQNVIKTARPFLDGTVKFPKINPGGYEVIVRHPNIPLPVITRPIRVLPVGDTKISLVLDPAKFRNTPIEDIPDANLGPVQDAANSVAETVLPLANKVPGEAILAQDWNTMANAVRDIALAVVNLTQLVSPVGHNHPELEKKFGETSGNFEALINSVTVALAELQRQIQAQRVRTQITDVLDKAGNVLTEAQRKDFLDTVKVIENTSATPIQYARDVRNAAVKMQTQLTELLDKKASDPEFIKLAEVANLQQSIEFATAQRTVSHDAELAHFRKVDRTLGGGLNFNATTGRG